jgi:hypothetical protein
MASPTMVGIIERRLLINYRVDPEILAAIVPAPFRPQLIGGVGLAGICLIRLGHLRPQGLPAAVGTTTENAAHRIAVEWDGHDGIQHGVYIPRRDTSSRLTAVVGGRLFPGAHHLVRFSVREARGRFDVAFDSRDGQGHVSVSMQRSSELADDSIFSSLADASTFFEQSPLGYSATRRPGWYDGVELRCDPWRVESLHVTDVSSSFFDDGTLFPPGTATFDSGLLMHDLPATWTPRPMLIGAGAERLCLSGRTS